MGTGTAGSIIISQIPSDDVLVLEAGIETSSSLLDIPILTPILHKSSFDWDYLTVPQDSACHALKDNQSHWTRGRIYGGSNILNNLIHHRGSPHDYRGWFTNNNNDYNYEKEILPHFIASERFLGVSPARFKTKIADAFIAAGEDLIMDGDFRVPNLNQNNGSRWSASHFNRNYPREGHTLTTNAYVTRVLFQHRKAVGVEYISNGMTFHVFATKGVILAAGVIETPKILLLSGVGPASDLKNHSIPLKLDVPGVGRNLQDHVTTGMDLILINETLEVHPTNLLSVTNLYNYFVYGTGPLTFAGCDALGFVNTEPELMKNFSDLSFMLMPVGISDDAGIHLAKVINLKDSVWDSYYENLVSKSKISILPILLHPKSRGYIKLRSNDPLDSPIINPRYLTDDDDIRMLVKGIKIIELLTEMPQMVKFGTEINPAIFPGCSDFLFRTTEYWECYIRQLTLTMYHPVGTCRMGDKTDEDAVVSPTNFKVHGLDNLFIVDGSILPNLPSGNPNAVIAMLAQKFLSTIK